MYQKLKACYNLKHVTKLKACCLLLSFATVSYFDSSCIETVFYWCDKAIYCADIQSIILLYTDCDFSKPIYHCAITNGDNEYKYKKMKMEFSDWYKTESTHDTF